MSQIVTTTDVPAVAAAIRSHTRFCVVTHENPDGDALGSMLAAKLGLDALGKDAVMYLTGAAPLPAEYHFLPLSGSCARFRRISKSASCSPSTARTSAASAPTPRRSTAPAWSSTSITITTTTASARLNLVVDEASSTAEIVRDILGALDVSLTPDIAEALYVGLVTDTGRFQYTNTTPKALRLAAELVEAGANVHDIFRHVYETVQFAKLKLLARALERAQLYEGGRIVVSYLLRDDFAEVGAEEPYSEGIIDSLRAVEGSEMVALIREPPRDEGPARRISLRSSRDEVDVSAIARERGGGGHRQAAGFSSEESIAEIIDFLHREFVRVTAVREPGDAAAGA